MVEVFPRRNLGAAEDWGRHVENRIRGIYGGSQAVSQALGNFSRVETSRGSLLSRTIARMGEASQLLHESALTLQERFTFDSYETNLPRNAFGSSLSVTSPDWARAAVVFVGVRAISDPGNGWLARVDIFAEAHPITSYNDSIWGREVAVAGMGYDPESGAPRATVATFNSFPGARFLDEDSRQIFLRPYAIQVGGGSTSVTHRVELSMEVIWVG